MTTIYEIKIDTRFSRVERQAAKLLEVDIAEVIRKPQAVFDADRSYAEIFSTKCGKTLVISANDDMFSAALCGHEPRSARELNAS